LYLKVKFKEVPQSISIKIKNRIGIYYIYLVNFLILTPTTFKATGKSPLKATRANCKWS